MGFKCPVCRKDFERNQEVWLKHLEHEHDGVGKDILLLYQNIDEEKKEIVSKKANTKRSN